MGEKGSRVVVLDAGALIAFERADAKMRALVRQASSANVQFVIPAGVLAQVWRDPARQVVLRSLVNATLCRVAVFDRVMAEAAGILCSRTGTSDVVDASVVLIARRERAIVITSDVDDLRRLDPHLRVAKI